MIIACSQTLYIPSVETVSDERAIEELTTGRKLYIQHCGGCHNLYRPERFTAQHWNNEMDEMKVEAKISDAQAEMILKYLTGYKTRETES